MFTKEQIKTVVIAIIAIVFSGFYIAINKFNIYQQERTEREDLTQGLISSQQKALEKTKSEIERLKQEQNKQQEGEELKIKVRNQQPPTLPTPQAPLIKIYKTSEIVAQNKKYIVYVWCQTSNGIVNGSGIVMGRANNDLVVLTNKHVTKYAKTPPAGVPPCVVDAGENGTYYAQPIYYPSIASQEEMALVDFSFLEVKEPITGTNVTYDPKTEQFVDKGLAVPNTKLLSFNTFPEICPLSKLKMGEEIAVLGYPAIGGGEFLGIPTPKLTTTEGIISSEVSSFDTYFVSSAKIEQGNSGGGAFLNTTGCLAGMPTFAKIGAIESLGRLINLANLNEKYLKYIFNLVHT